MSYKFQNKKLSKNDSGQAIVYSLVMLAIVTGIFLILAEQGEKTKKISNKNIADQDVQLALNALQVHFAAGGNCNSNFFDQALAGTRTAIYGCNPGAVCHAIGPGGADTFLKYNGTSTTWDPTVPGTGALTNKVKFKSYTYSIFTDASAEIYPQSCLAPGPNPNPASPISCFTIPNVGWPATAKLSFTLEKRLGELSSDKGSEKASNTVNVDLYVRVTTDHSPGSPDGLAATKILGCPKNTSTTTLF